MSRTTSARSPAPRRSEAVVGLPGTLTGAFEELSAIVEERGGIVEKFIGDLDAASRERQRVAVGACVHVAARLQRHADPGEILVGPVCHGATTAAAEFEPRGTLALKGLGDMPAWRLVRTTEAPSAALPFVGRDGELDRLRSAFERVRTDGPGRAVIIGPPGQGKTRLAQEFLRPRPSAQTVWVPVWRLLQW